MSDKRTPFRRRAGAALAKWAYSLGRKSLSPRRNVTLSRLLGKVGAAFAKRDRRYVRGNLAIAFPEGIPFKFGQFMDKLLGNFIRAMLDMVYAAWDWEGRVWELFDEKELNAVLDRIQELYEKKNRFIVVSGHVGSWELLGAALGLRFDLRAVAKKLHYEPYNELVMEMRRRLGYGIYYQEDPVRMMARHLKGGGALGLIADQDIAHNAGVFVPFFGVDAYTPSGPASLSLLTKTPMLPMLVIYHGGRYHLELGEPIWPPEKRTEETVAMLTEAWQMQVEGFVRKYPDQWAWFHRRWKTRPEGEE